jgi:hypothetical protein
MALTSRAQDSLAQPLRDIRFVGGFFRHFRDILTDHRSSREVTFSLPIQADSL